MNATQAEILTHIKWIMDTQVKMSEQVEDNRSRLDRMMRPK